VQVAPNQPVVRTELAQTLQEQTRVAVAVATLVVAREQRTLVAEVVPVTPQVLLLLLRTPHQLIPGIVQMAI